jgi:hypothetical protein
MEQRSPCDRTPRTAKRFNFPKTTVWRTLRAQGMKEMVDRVNAATRNVLLDSILYATDHIRNSGSCNKRALFTAERRCALR